MNRNTKLMVVLCCLSTLMAGSARADLMAHWRLDDGVGATALDSSGNERHAQMEGAPIWGVGALDGALETSLGNYLVVPGYTGVLGAEPRSCTAWINTTQNNGVIFGWGLITNGTKWIVRVNSGGQLRCEVDGGFQFANTSLLDGEWHHVAAVLTPEAPNVEDVLLYVDGVHDGTSSISARAVNTIEDMDVTLGQNPHSLATRPFVGLLDDMRVYNQALTEEELQAVMLGKGPGVATELAGQPSPEDEVVDVPRDAVLTWVAGEFAATHDVYFGESFDDVNAADGGSDLLVGVGLSDTRYDVGRLEFGQSYYWRVDEVNSPPDNTVFKGDIWSFEVEPIGYPIEDIQVTASSAHDQDMIPEKTIDGSGLNELDLHNSQATDMWLSGMGDPTPSIQYTFDQAYKLHELWVWNSNQLVESFVGLGAKDVIIEISENGTDWTLLEGTPPFAQAPGAVGYAHNTTIDFGGAVARHVKLGIQSGYGFLPQFGLSELRFFYIPTFAREAQPADGDTADGVDVVLNWRSGREAAAHEVYLGTDPGALTLAATVQDSSYAPAALDYATTYYWQIMEVNEAEDPGAYAGPLWRFDTPAYGIVDDFEAYDDTCNRIFFAWQDGLGHNGGEDVDNCSEPSYNGNGSGSIVGHAIAPFAERSIVNSGNQSMPLAYDNSGGGASEASLALESQDWTASGIKTLSLAFHGTTGNTGELYIKINSTKLGYDGAATDIGMEAWQVWNIDLAGADGDLSNVTSLAIGVDGAGASGMLYVDDIRVLP